MTFETIFEKTEVQMVYESIYSAHERSVESALASSKPLRLADFAALLSPAAEKYLEQIATKSQSITQRRFGKTVQLFAPLYLSNECQNICTYCGFSFGNKVVRKTLNEDELRAEAEVLRLRGFQHILLLTGESYRKVGVDYLERALQIVRPLFAQVSIEVQPLEVSDYQRLRACGLHAVYVYQETYDREKYKQSHPKGRKSNMAYRLGTPERAGEAGVHKIGLGALLGLADWRVDSWFVALHLSYLRSKFWRTKYSISFPRLRPAEGVSSGCLEVPDEKQLLQLICAYRLFDENVELSLSTRESIYFRDNAFPLGITTMSAGSSTEPGGYSQKGTSLAQFSVNDERSVNEVHEAITERGYDVVWKDWDMALEPGLYSGV